MLTKHVVLSDDNTMRFRPAAAFGLRASGRPMPSPSVAVETLSKKDVRDLVRAPEVKGVAPVMPTRLPRTLGPNTFDDGAGGGSTWGLAAIKALESPFDGAGVLPCVLDTGIDADHEAFAGVALMERDFTGEGDGDRNGHGSHCAGTVFGREVQGERLGVATGVERALIGKVLGENGGGSSEMIFSALQWAIDEDADVVSMSLGFDFPGLVEALTADGWPAALATSVTLQAYGANLRMFDALMEMIEARQAFGADLVVVAAAGNESHRDIDPNFEVAASLPAAASGVVSVGALGPGQSGGLSLADFSNTLPMVSAPGVDVRSAKPGGGVIGLSGTSMACPHVAGALALWWQRARGRRAPATPASVTAQLLSHCRIEPLAPGIDQDDRGAGLVTAPLA